MLLVSEIEVLFEVYAQSQPCYRIFMPGRELCYSKLWPELAFAQAHPVFCSVLCDIEESDGGSG